MKWRVKPTTPNLAIATCANLAVTTALIVFCGCHHGKTAPTEQPLNGTLPVSSGSTFRTFPSAEYVGSAACEPCHREEARRHKHSRHATTMHIMDRGSLGKLAPPTGRVAGTDVIYGPHGSGYEIMAFGQEDERVPLSYALGSGKTGMTFVGFLNSYTLLEARASYFPARRSWYITPGHETQPAENVAVFYPPDAARKCFSCHSVTLPFASLKPDPAMFGVGCESCHGPGSEHVKAVRANNRNDLRIADLSTWSADELNNQICGKCHRTEQSVAQQTEAPGMTLRFQPYGLSKSRCFIESGRKLSCVTCHDPHANVSANIEEYEQKCKGCHNRAAGAQPMRVPNAPRSCPVNARSGCIDCHMPSGQVFPKTNLPIKMADHWIRIHPGMAQPARAGHKDLQ